MKRTRFFRAGVLAAATGLGWTGGATFAQGPPALPPVPAFPGEQVGSTPDVLRAPPGVPTEAFEESEAQPSNADLGAPTAAPGSGPSAGGGAGPGGPSSGQPSVGTGQGGAAPPSGTPDSKKFHGHRYPILPFAPPGAAPIPPTGPGYYTLLAELQGKCQPKPPRWPYVRGGPIPPSFHEVDFTYLDSLPFEDRDWAEKLKRIPFCDSWLFSTGGEYRYRYNYESNTRRTGIDDSYDLFRNRTYADLWYEDQFRVYAEFIYGDSYNNNFVPYTRDLNRGDIANLFVDVKLGELGSKNNPVYARFGRQELIYGSQRLVSTNDWGNNRQRFDGAKLFYRAADWDVDAFVARPVIPKSGDLDSNDHNVTFSGLWATNKPKKGTFLDLYYLNLDNVNPNVATGRFRRGGFNVSTFGSRYYSRLDNGVLLDFEGAFQFGHFADQSIMAQMADAAVGYYFKDCWGTPTIWAAYDYASGDPNPGQTGTRRTFNQLFNFGHYYFGFVDNVARQNIRDWNLQAYLYPTNWLTTGLQYHVFRLDSNQDALNAATGAFQRQDRTGRAGDDVGQEIDVLANVHLTDRQDFFVSYSRFFAGTFLKTVDTGRRRSDQDYLYAQYSFRY